MIGDYFWNTLIGCVERIEYTMFGLQCLQNGKKDDKQIRSTAVIDKEYNV